VKKFKVKYEGRQSEVSFMLDYNTALMRNLFRLEYKKAIIRRNFGYQIKVTV